jgi:hypothetical protein
VRVIIACAGASEKWGNDLGVPKHLAPLTAHHGVPLLYRTVGQIREFTDDVHVTAPARDARYRVPGVTVHERDGNGLCEYTSTRDLWAKAGRTVLLLGDVYWTDAALETVFSFRPQTYRVFGRFGPSKVTGTPYGEIFAASWWSGQHGRMDKRLAHIHGVRATGVVTRPPGWMLLRAWQGTPLSKHRVLPNWFTEIDDLTDDFDTVADYLRHPATRDGG